MPSRNWLCFGNALFVRLFQLSKRTLKNLPKSCWSILTSFSGCCRSEFHFDVWKYLTDNGRLLLHLWSGLWLVRICSWCRRRIIVVGGGCVQYCFLVEYIFFFEMTIQVVCTVVFRRRRILQSYGYKIKRKWRVINTDLKVNTLIWFNVLLS